MTTQPPVYPMPPAENPSSTPELLSDEEMRSRAAAYAQKIYEQQLEAYRIQRAQVLAEQQARAEYLRQWQAYQQQFYSPQPAVRVDPDTGAQTFVAGQPFFPPPSDVPASPMPQQPFPPETPVPAPEEMQDGVPAPEPAATVPVADEISEEENLMPPSKSRAEPPENPEEAAEQEEVSAQENSVPAEENSSEETVPAVEEEAGDVPAPEVCVPAAEAVVPAAEEPSGAPDDDDAEPAVEAASEAKKETPPPVAPVPKKISVFSLFLLVVCAAALAAGAYILFSDDPRFEQPRKNFFSLIGREPRAEAEKTENEVSVPAEGESGAENYDEADYFMN